ncbi:MAG: CPBP family intramembrane glutamic endopeptidase, partial [Patescibacteria group bacterium]
MAKLSYLLLLVFGSLLYIEIFLSTFLKSLNFYNQYLFNLFFVLILLLIFFFYNKFEYKTPFKNNFSLNKKIINIFIIIGLVFPIALLGRLIDPKFDIIYGNLNNFANLNISSVFLFLLLTLIIVVKEEIIQRSLLQKKISLMLGSFVSITIVSINFSLYHFFYYSLFGLKTAIVASLSIFMASILLSVLFEKTQSVLTTILAHFLINFMILIQIFLIFNKFFTSEIIFWILWFLLFCYSILSFKKKFAHLKLTFYEIG